MLMRGDLQKIYDQINPVLDALKLAIEDLQTEVDALKNPKVAPKAAKSTKSTNKAA